MTLVLHFRFAGILAAIVALLRAAEGAEPSPAAPAPTSEAIRAAVAKSLPLLEAASKTSMERRSQCFTCHNQGLPVMALTTARARGFTVDADNLRRQVEFTA